MGGYNFKIMEILYFNYLSTLSKESVWDGLCQITGTKIYFAVASLFQNLFET